MNWNILSTNSRHKNLNLQQEQRPNLNKISHNLNSQDIHLGVKKRKSKVKLKVFLRIQLPKRMIDKTMTLILHNLTIKMLAKKVIITPNLIKKITSMMIRLMDNRLAASLNSNNHNKKLHHNLKINNNNNNCNKSISPLEPKSYLKIMSLRKKKKKR